MSDEVEALKDIIEPLVKRIRALEALERPHIASSFGTVGAATTSQVVTHNLPYTPADGDIAIWFCAPGNAKTCYIDTYGPVTFTLHTDVVPGGAGAIIGWKSIR